jgi:hypothetical protein
MLKKDPRPSGDEKAPPLAGREKRMGEASGRLPRVKAARHMARVSRGEISCLLPGTCMKDAQQ